LFYVGMYCAEIDFLEKESMMLLIPCLIWPLLLFFSAGWIYKKYTMKKGDL
jgi:hypothetical protein